MAQKCSLSRAAAKFLFDESEMKWLTQRFYVFLTR